MATSFLMKGDKMSVVPVFILKGKEVKIKISKCPKWLKLTADMKAAF